ncbi:hypothetical protein JCM10914A_00970 [Paenibacillus sp. JCM 10914]
MRCLRKSCRIALQVKFKISRRTLITERTTERVHDEPNDRLFGDIRRSRGAEITERTYSIIER